MTNSKAPLREKILPSVETWLKGFNEADKKATENFLNNIGMMVSNAVKEAMEGFDKFQKCNFGDWENKAKRSNKNPYSESNFTRKPEKTSRKMDTYVLAQLLSKTEDNGDLDLNGYCIEDCDEAKLSAIDIETADNISVSIDNASISGDAFYAIMKKVGDNADVSGNNTMIGTARDTTKEIGESGNTSDNNSWSFVNATLSEAAFAVLLSKIMFLLSATRRANSRLILISTRSRTLMIFATVLIIQPSRWIIPVFQKDFIICLSDAAETIVI